MKRILFFFIGWLLISTSFAATYYLRADGTAANKAAATSCGAAGTAMSIATHDGEAFSAGDVLVVCDDGGTYRDQLDVPSSGSGGSPITYQNESGGSPIISGANLVTTWGDLGGNVWSAALATTAYRVYLDRTLGTAEAGACPGALNVDQEWCWIANVLYQYSTSDPDTRYTTPGTEAVVRNNPIYVVNRDYITVDGIHLSFARNEGLIIGGTSDHIIVTNSEIDYSWNGIAIYDNAGDFNEITDNVIHDSERHGIRCTHQGSTSDGNIISGNTIYDNARMGIWLEGNYYTVEDNLVYDNGRTVAGTEAIGIFVYSAGIGAGSGDNNVVRYNQVYNQLSGGNEGTAIEMDQWCDSNEIYYNTAWNNDGRCLHNHNAASNLWYGNSCYGNAQDSSGQLVHHAEIMVGEVRSTNVEVKNNLAYATEANTYAIFITDNADDAAGLDIDSNDWYATAANWYYFGDIGGAGNVLATWNAFAPVGTDFNADPLYTDGASGDLTLQGGSPARDTGTDLGASYDDALRPCSVWPGGVVIEDQDLYGAGWEIGAYLYGCRTQVVMTPILSIRADP